MKLIPDYQNPNPETILYSCSPTQGERWWKSRLKSAYEIAFATAAIANPAAFFLLLFAATGIYLEDRHNPLYFRQTQFGYKLIKLRTMVFNAEQVKVDPNDMTQIKNGDDPRVTRIGGLLRKYSIDELTQFFNVFLDHRKFGLVGPRAIGDQEYIALVQPYVGIEEWATIYHNSKQQGLKDGIIGLSAICGREQTLPERLKLETLYINRASFMSDLRIQGYAAWEILAGTGN